MNKVITYEQEQVPVQQLKPDDIGSYWKHSSGFYYILARTGRCQVSFICLHTGQFEIDDTRIENLDIAHFTRLSPGELTIKINE